jgi:hypothetical protein
MKMNKDILLEQIKTAIQGMDPDALEHFVKLMPDFMKCFTDEQLSATLIIKEVKEEFGDVHSINADEFEMNDMIFGLCEVLGLNDLQKIKIPAYLN